VPPRKSTHRSRARFIARTLPGAVAADYPGFIEPELATLRKVPPAGGRWVHEIKFDGYRMQLHVSAGKPALYTRSGLNWTSKFSPVAAAAVDLPVNHAVIDGEVVVQEPDGRASFGLLQADLAAGRTDRMVYYAFDLLHLDGFDLRAAPLVDRKRVLAGILEGAPPPIFYSEHFETDAAALFAQAQQLGLEGIISKRRDAPYRSGRQDNWIKTKCLQRGKFVVVGFVPESGSSIAALRLGEMREGKLMYAGKVGTGWSRKVAADIRRTLNPLVRPAHLLDQMPTKKDTVWIEPRFEADVEFTEISADGYVRHPSFKGLAERETKRPVNPRRKTKSARAIRSR
jgi:bifunctional non-homologous end joining protein LigD